MLRKKRFAELVDRQLDVFEEDARALLAEAAEADAAWTNATADDSEELFGDYQLIVDDVAERLLDIRETYASTLEEPEAQQYRAAFNHAASKRFRGYSALLDDETT